MWLTGLIVLCGTALTIQATGVETYHVEFVIESNVTMDISTVLGSLNPSQISQPGSFSVTKLNLTAVCEIVGDQSTCNCSFGYVWSNAVCDSLRCCKDSSCSANISDFNICIPKVTVCLSGLVTAINKLTDSGPDLAKKLTDHFQELNGFKGLNVTGERTTSADFEVELSVLFENANLNRVIETLENKLEATITVVSSGLVSIQYPKEIVDYNSHQTLNCTYGRAIDSAGWDLTYGNIKSNINNGIVSEVTFESGNSSSHPSKTNIIIRKVTGNWAGKYTCSFSKGPKVKHVASAQLDVALLPDVITMTTNPLSVDCSEGSDKTVEVNATIQATTEPYTVKATYNNGEQTVTNTSNMAQINYSSNININCKPTSPKRCCQTVTFTFTNRNHKNMEGKINLTVVYVGDTTCPADQKWPKTPSGSTVVSQECEPGKVGSIERTCLGNTWSEILSKCISENLKKVANAANDFAQGLGATQAVALSIFSGLKNSSTSGSEMNGAETQESINVLNTMADASATISLTESILPDFLGAASNILNNSWELPDKSLLHDMSSKYLNSVEGLVRNIQVNNTQDLNTQNLDLKIWRVEPNTTINHTVFDVAVILNASGTVKTMAMKELGKNLEMKFKDTQPPSIVLTAILENSSSRINIKLGFPPIEDSTEDSEVFCVFWNTSTNEWSREGCWLESIGNQTFCECNHLTSFSMLMSKISVSLPFLDEITYVGLGVSICSLLVFLVIEVFVWSAVVKSNLSHFRHTAMVNISLCLFLADCSFLASSFPQALSPTWCLVLTVCKHFFFTAMFFWMLCLSLMLLHQVIFVFSPLRRRVYMFVSSILGYVCPTVIVGATYVYYRYTDTNYHDDKTNYHDDKTCWLIYNSLLKGSIHAFILPVGTIVLTNMFSMAVVILTLVKSSIPEGGKEDDKEMVKSIMKAVVFLTPVFGVTWALGFAVLMTPSKDPMSPVIHYTFTIVNSLQGFFILLTGCFAEKRVRDELCKLITSGRPASKSKSDSMKNLTTANTKD
ncbi:adhesion G-protein coupled receptor F2 [Hypomesus transpacificus]|uniref:adhesion G-protein coupled receptor F2 n=1 Tax=Hypomesus transpacificus TaxID=137520 RepID=UPI001F07C509|nr:adhesion G-protein coupled receptor F2 [Hypomesus transpacificus]